MSTALLAYGHTTPYSSRKTGSPLLAGEELFCAPHNDWTRAPPVVAQHSGTSPHDQERPVADGEGVYKKPKQHPAQKNAANPSAYSNTEIRHLKHQSIRDGRKPRIDQEERTPPSPPRLYMYVLMFRRSGLICLQVGDLHDEEPRLPHQRRRKQGRHHCVSRVHYLHGLVRQGYIDPTLPARIRGWISLRSAQSIVFEMYYVAKRKISAVVSPSLRAYTQIMNVTHLDYRTTLGTIAYFKAPRAFPSIPWYSGLRPLDCRLINANPRASTLKAQHT